MDKFFEIGDEIKVKTGNSRRSSYQGKYHGCIGIVDRLSGGKIGVLLNGLTNPSSDYGVFWFCNNEIEHTGNKINNKEEIYMDKNYRPVIINFLSGGNTNVPYTYAAYEDYGEGDYVVVHTGHHGISVAKVKAIGTEEDKVEHGREIICKVDMTTYNERKAKAKRVAELESAMNARVQVLQKTALFEMLAEKDEELAKMLKELKELG